MPMPAVGIAPGLLCSQPCSVSDSWILAALALLESAMRSLTLGSILLYYCKNSTMEFLFNYSAFGEIFSLYRELSLETEA